MIIFTGLHFCLKLCLNLVSRKVWWWLGVKKGQKKKMLIKRDRRAAPRGLASTAGLYAHQWLLLI